MNDSETIWVIAFEKTKSFPNFVKGGLKIIFTQNFTQSMYINC